MNSSSVVSSMEIIVTFLVLFFTAEIIYYLNSIKLNWIENRCNPVFMAFAEFFGHDSKKNFSQCVQSTQSDYMKYLLKPINYNMNTMTSITGSLGDSLHYIRHSISHIRSFISDIYASIMAIFINIILFTLKLIINVKDLFNKLIGIFGTFVYVTQGSIYTINSVWQGPPGGLVRALCFHPDTLIRLKDNSLVKMKDLPLNSILKSGTRVISVMKISNLDNNNNQFESIYRIKSGEDNNDILVTGSHLIYNDSIKRYIKVSELMTSIKTSIKCDELSCLITSDNRIPIGKWIFRDWEDDT